MERDGGTGDDAFEWTSRYGSVIATFHDVATVDGINEAGLVGNALYLAETDYGEASRADKPGMSVGAWLQYVLDSFATVEEAVDALGKDEFRVVAPVLPGGKAATGHVALSDRSGDSAIIEYVDGELIIHHGAQYKVMTNSPPFDQQLAIDAYWKQIGGMTMLPGTSRAADRFARASFYIDAVPAVEDRRRATATVMSIMRGVSVPIGIADPERPNIATTIWRTVTDHDAGRYYFESALSPTVFWVDLANLDLSEGAPVLKLNLEGDPILAGEVSAEFEPAEPFRFLSH
jgi:choloylglycine hydrolase